MVMFLGMIVVAILIAVPIMVAERFRLRAFLAREVGRVYFVCTANRGWHDFIQNNVLPVLPDHYTVVWRPSLSGHLPFLYFPTHSFGGVAKPCMVLVTRQGLIHRSLNEPLARFKQHPKASEAIRAACREMIATTERELRAEAVAAAGA